MYGTNSIRSCTLPMSSPHRSVDGSEAADPPALFARSDAPTNVAGNRPDIQLVTSALPPLTYEQMLRNLDYIRDALREDVYDDVYERCRGNLRDMMWGRYESFTQKLESLGAHVDTMESRLVLCESHIPDDSSADLLRGPTAALRSFAHLTTQVQRQRTRANRLRERGDASPQSPAKFRDDSQPSPIVLHPFELFPLRTERSEQGGSPEETSHVEQAAFLRDRIPSHVVRPY